MSSKYIKNLVLVVDDAPLNLKLMTKLLESDYQVITASDGHKAISLCMSPDKPDLILLDMMMPGISGIDVLMELRSNAITCDIPVIFVTADKSDETHLNCLSMGAEDYLTKPIVSKILLARVRSVLGRKQTEAQLRLAAHVFEHIGEGILIINDKFKIVDANPSFTRLTGYTSEELNGKSPCFLSAGHSDTQKYSEMWGGVHDDGVWQSEVWNRIKDGDIRPMLLTLTMICKPNGRDDFYIASFFDMSMQKAVEEQIRHMAQHDVLTGLPNRSHFHGNLRQAIAMAKREKGELSIFFIDIDKFKSINDTFGHSIGDKLLIEFSKRLQSSVRESDLVARLAGDEFVVMLSMPQGQSREYSTVAADKLLGILTKPYDIDGQLLHVTSSMGISLYPRDGHDIDLLLDCADIAMYRAKRSGRAGHADFGVLSSRSRH